jgi:hypothetical protein
MRSPDAFASPTAQWAIAQTEQWVASAQDEGNRAATSTATHKVSARASSERAERFMHARIAYREGISP